MQTTQSRWSRQWHPGEEAMHRRLHVPHEDNPTAHGLPMAWAAWMTRSPLIALGTVDGDDRVWTTVLGGRAGMLTPTTNGVLRLGSPAHLECRTGSGAAVWAGYDPVLEALFVGDGRSAADPSGAERKIRNGAISSNIWIVDHGDRGKLVGGLAIDLDQRMRVKLAGRMFGGAIRVTQPDADPDHQDRVDVDIAIAVEESLGNCPKYVNRKTVWPHEAAPHLISDTLPLTSDAIDLIGRSDIFFISSKHGADSMDTNHRGGPPGFVRVLTNSTDAGVTLVYPEYSGNRLFQTLGNVVTDPAVGITFPDFETGDVVYLTARAEVLTGSDAADLLPHSTMAVRVNVDAARFVRDGLPFRGRLLDASPYNPPVRRLASEISPSGLPSTATDANGKAVSLATATLIRTVPITPTISRHTFRLSPDPASTRSGRDFPGLEPWRAGQHVVLDFSARLDRGWSHMRDHDPRSLNDDYIRSFTISSAPPPLRANDNAAGPLDGIEFDLTVRRQGPATDLLARWNPDIPLGIAILGFGGGEEIRFGATGSDDQDIVVVAGGVGITPFLAQAQHVLDSGRGLHVLWSMRADDTPLAIDVMERIDGAAAVTTLFVTGELDTVQQTRLHDLVRRGAQVRNRRITRADVQGQATSGRRHFYVSAGRNLRQATLEWVDGEPAASESFDY